MAYLTQAASSIANSPKFSFYAWVRAVTPNAPSPSGEWFPILSFGDRSSRGGPSIIGIQTNSSLNLNYLSAGFYGQKASVDMRSYSDDPRILTFGSQALWTPSAGFNTPSTNYQAAGYDAAKAAKLGPNKWIHIALAVDFSATSQKSAGNVVASACKAICLINGTYLGRWSYPNPNQNLINQTDMPAGFGHDKIWSSTFDETRDFLVWPGVDGSDSWTGPADTTDDGNNVTIPGWSIAFNGFEIGIPAQAADAASINKIDFGDVQIWVGQYIDPQVNANFSKFVSISNGIGTPVNRATAAAAFGTPDICFAGDKSHFYTNSGNGGAFTKVGTINDFTPAPGF